MNAGYAIAGILRASLEGLENALRFGCPGKCDSWCSEGPE